VLASGTTALMTDWQAFVATQVRPHGRDFAGPRPVRIDLHLYTTTQAPDRSDTFLNVDGFSDAVFSVVASFLTEDAGRFLAEVEAIKL
jgi:60 kDa SS-A/Ro ribonucleoprotein